LSKQKKQKAKSNKEITTEDLFGSIPPPLDVDPFSGIDIENISIYTNKSKSTKESELELTEKSTEKISKKTIDTSIKISTNLLQAQPILVENEAILYYCLKHLNGKTTTMLKISKVTGISVNTLRACLKRIRKKNMLEYYGLKNEAGQIGFAAKVITNEFILKGDQNRLKQKLSKINYDALPILNKIDNIFNE